MKSKKKIIIFSIYSFFIAGIAVLNIKYHFILTPKDKELIDRQIDLITISTVFAGFSFTTLGLLLGLSSEKLIELIKNTSIMIKKVGRITESIIFFIASVILSLIMMLGLERKIFTEQKELENSETFLYVMCIGYLIAGVCLFVYSVYELYDLIKRIYRYNNQENKKNIVKVKKELKQLRDKEENSIYDD